MRINTLFILLAALMLVPVASSTVAQDGNETFDTVILYQEIGTRAGPKVYKEGSIREAKYNKFVYRGKDRREESIPPYKVQWIKFAEMGNDYNEAVGALQSGAGYEKAARTFFRALNHDGNRDSWGGVWQIRNDDRQAYVAFATYYYHGLALLKIGQERMKVANRVYKEILKVFPIGLSMTARLAREKDFNKNPDKVGEVKKAISDAIEVIKRELRDAMSESGTEEEVLKYVEEIVEPASTTSDLENAVSKFMEVFKVLAAAKFTTAIRSFDAPFKNPVHEDTLDFGKYRPIFFFRLKLAAAEANFGLLQFEKGAYEIDESMTTLPSRPSTNPSLAFIADRLVSRDKNYFNFLVEGYTRTADAWQSKPDYRMATRVYRVLLDKQAFKSPEWTKEYNDARLDIALCQAKQGNITEAENRLEEMLGEFKPRSVSDIDNTFNTSALISPTNAALYMGVYLTLGKVYHTQYNTTNNKKYIFKAFESYQRVTALFAVDNDKRAEALYWLVMLANEIADTEYDKFKGKADKLPDEGYEINPYNFYKNLASQYRNELKQHYPRSNWAQQL